MTELDQFLLDAARLPDNVLSFLYGSEIYCFRRVDNSMAVVCPLKRPVPTPFIYNAPQEHQEDPRKGDLIVLEDSSGDVEYGRILWIDRGNDCARVLLFQSQETDSFFLSAFDSVDQMSGKIRWRINT